MHREAYNNEYCGKYNEGARLVSLLNWPLGHNTRSVADLPVIEIDETLETEEWFKTPVLENSQRAEIKSDFLRLAQKWREETGLFSSVARRTKHVAYQRILEMGSDAIPLILTELQERPDHWFWALHTLTGADPTPEEGNFYDAVAAWLQWGKERRYIK